MNKRIFGLSIIEALVATVIVGIGFVAVLQMVSFSVRSIDTSGERTKANFIVNMIAEDIIGSKDSINKTGVKYMDELSNKSFVAEVDQCGPKKLADGINLGATDDGKVSNLYDDVAPAADDKAYAVKDAKWQSLFKGNRFVKCQNENDIKTVRVYKICKWDSCTLQNTNVTDEGMYIGRIQINLNGGKKRKYLYFQADYELKEFKINKEGDEPAGMGDGGNAGG